MAFLVEFVCVYVPALFRTKVYRCKCGFAFGDPSEPLTEESAERLKTTRNVHFAEVFAADVNG
jgi:hypothetical protein